MKTKAISSFVILLLILTIQLVDSQWQQTAITSRNTYSLYGLTNEYELTMELSKKTYKKYEPVIAKFSFVNHDNEPVEIYNLFNNETPEPKIYISDEYGNSWSENHNPLNFESFKPPPSYIVQPDETLYVSMLINNWGNELSPINYKEGINEIYFGQWAYFKPSKYKAYYYVDNKELRIYGSLRTKEVEFEITALTQEDSDVINMYKEAKKGSLEQYEYIIEKFSGNPFTEHVYVYYLATKHYEILSNVEYKLKDQLEDNYLQFIKKYPDSYYLLHDRFLFPFIYKLTVSKQNINDAITEIRNRVKNPLMNKFLNNYQRIQNIKTRNVQ